MIKTVGSVCSGIEAATVAWEPLGFKFQWLSEIATFPTKVLAEKYPSVPNVGDMNNIPDLIREKSIDSPELQVEDNGWKKTKENDGKKQCYRKETQRWDFILTVEHHMFCTKGRRSHDILLIRH